MKNAADTGVSFEWETRKHRADWKTSYRFWNYQIKTRFLQRNTPIFQCSFNKYDVLWSNRAFTLLIFPFLSTSATLHIHPHSNIIHFRQSTQFIFPSESKFTTLFRNSFDRKIVFFRIHLCTCTGFDFRFNERFGERHIQSWIWRGSRRGNAIARWQLNSMFADCSPGDFVHSLRPSLVDTATVSPVMFPGKGKL